MGCRVVLVIGDRRFVPLPVPFARCANGLPSAARTRTSRYDHTTVWHDHGPDFLPLSSAEAVLRYAKRWQPEVVPVV
jgi:hypothetical protein